MKKKYNEIKEGDKYLMYYPYNDKKAGRVKTYEVICWVPNPKAGKPIKDMWGGTCWEEDAGHFVTRCVETGEKGTLNYYVGSENKIADVAFFTTEEEKAEMIAEYEKRWVKSFENDWLYKIKEFFKDVDWLRENREINTELADKPMLDLLKAIDDLKTAYIKARVTL